MVFVADVAMYLMYQMYPMYLMYQILLANPIFVLAMLPKLRSICACPGSSPAVSVSLVS